MIENILILGVGAVATVFATYYISFAIYMIVASLHTGARMIPESYRTWRGELAAAYSQGWDGTELGVTMPDGGEPVEEEEDEKE